MTMPLHWNGCVCVCQCAFQIRFWMWWFVALENAHNFANQRWYRFMQTPIHKVYMEDHEENWMWNNFNCFSPNSCKYRVMWKSSANGRIDIHYGCIFLSTVGLLVLSLQLKRICPHSGGGKLKIFTCLARLHEQTAYQQIRNRIFPSPPEKENK